MKRNHTVLNRKMVQRGRRLARWAADGMNWAPDSGRAELMAQGRAIAANHALCQALAQATDIVVAELGADFATQSTVTAAVEIVAAGDHRRRMALLAMQEEEFGQYSTDYVEIDHPDGGHRRVDLYPCGAEYNHGYRAGGTWVDGWWTGGQLPE